MSKGLAKLPRVAVSWKPDIRNRESEFVLVEGKLVACESGKKSVA